ncbi:uncharacterized protein LOC134778679 [Penaeus indicus]|uniref:uncharacterized protein LOC134778679 n=1 Tax=Penaeus indicus TaxID=29960 RepID=UPI00300D6270
MLVQASLPVNSCLLVVSVIFLVQYVAQVKDVFPWNRPSCVRECLPRYFDGPIKSRDPDTFAVIRDEYLVPPPTNPDRSPVDINEPVWRKLLDWSTVQENLNSVWKDQPPGTFVEVGVVDGDFMSQTLFLEKNLSWSGLLIEPDPRSFKILQQRRRNAWTSPMCVNYGAPTQKKYWLRDLEMDLPAHFVQLLMARSKLNQDTLTGDEERGSTIWVPCAPLSAILMAANMTRIDMLTISTGAENDEERIKDVLLSKAFDVKTVLIHYPTGRLFVQPYPRIPGYILDKERSTIQVKLYLKKSHCKVMKTGKELCIKSHYYDVEDSCTEYLCFGFLSVWT